MKPLFVVLLLVYTTLAQDYDIKPPHLSLLDPQGLRMAIDHEEGVTLFAVHYSVNKPVIGVESGDVNEDITERTGSEWVHENPSIVVNVGDTVNYWIYVLHNGIGHQLTDQSWVAVIASPTPPTEPTTTTATTSTITTTSTTRSTTTRSTTTRSTTPTRDPPTGGTPPGPTDGPAECEIFPCLIFEDDFNDLDLFTWEHEITGGGGGNWEFQYYSNNRSNSYVRDGTLYLKPTLTSEKFDEQFLSNGKLELWGGAPDSQCTGAQWWGCERIGNPVNIINPIQSARLRTVQSFSFKYGKIEVEAKMPKGDWLWPAIWMLPRQDFYGGWPTSGEIDLVESRGNIDLKNQDGRLMGHQNMGATMHWGPFWGYNKYDLTTTERSGDFGDNFHKYGVEWDENMIRFFLDDEETLKVEPPSGGFWELGGLNNDLPNTENPWSHGDDLVMAPFDKEFYIILNVAVGGTNGFFQDSWTNTPHPKPWSNTSPQAFLDFWNARDNWYPTWTPEENNGENAAMQVRSVRVWKLKPDA